MVRKPTIGSIFLQFVGWFATLGLLAVVPAHSRAQQPVGNDWLGKRVVPKYSDFQLKTQNQVVIPSGIETYRVEQVNGPWLWLYATGLGGWAPADQVVPVDQAIEFFSEYIRSNPGKARGYVMRARMMRVEKRDLDSALADANEAIRRSPMSAALYNNRGLVWYDKDQYDKAIADYNEAIRVDPQYAFAYHNRANAWCAKREYNKAIADYNECIRLGPDDPLAYSNRGAAWNDTKEYDKAIADFNEAIHLDPKFAEPYNHRAWLWATCPDAKYRDGKAAVQSATRACALSGWRDPEWLDTLAASYAEAGDFDAAVNWQSMAIELPTDGKKKDLYRSRLKLYQEKKPYRETQP